MKKIVMATAAIAMAASAFAVDISAAIKMNGSLFDMTCAKGAKPSLFKLDQPKAQKGHGQTGIDVTVSGDKAGATLVIGNGYSGNANLAYQDFKLWVKPLDMLKIELGSVDYNLNKESIDYAGCINGTGGQGYGFVLTPVDGLEIDAVLPSGYGKTWITDGTVGKAALLVKYNANEAGKFGLSAVYNGDETASYSVGYSNTIGKVSLFADAALDMTAVKGADEVGGIKVGRITSIKADAYAKFADGDFSVAGYAGYELKGVQELKLMSEIDKIFPMSASDKAELYSTAQVLSAKMRVDYKVGALGLYLYVADSDFIGHEDTMDNGKPNTKSTIKPGVTFNIGSAAFDVAVDVTSANKGPATISVPCSVAVNF